MGERVLNNVHGLMVFDSEPNPRFALMESKPLRGVIQGVFESAFEAAVSSSSQLSERDTVAFSLFNASFFQGTADSRFLLLMMAIEALLDPQPRSTAARLHVQELIAQTRNQICLRSTRPPCWAHCAGSKMSLYLLPEGASPRLASVTASTTASLHPVSSLVAMVCAAVSCTEAIPIQLSIRSMALQVCWNRSYLIC